MNFNTKIYFLLLQTQNIFVKNKFEMILLLNYMKLQIFMSKKNTTFKSQTRRTESVFFQRVESRTSRSLMYSISHNLCALTLCISRKLCRYSARDPRLRHWSRELTSPSPQTSFSIGFYNPIVVVFSVLQRTGFRQHRVLTQFRA